MWVGVTNGSASIKLAASAVKFGNKDNPVTNNRAKKRKPTISLYRNSQPKDTHFPGTPKGLEDPVECSLKI